MPQELARIVSSGERKRRQSISRPRPPGPLALSVLVVRRSHRVPPGSTDGRIFTPAVWASAASPGGPKNRA
ncbi:hypothetical protein NDU88_002541 [Pleurodeles waltl]|uniref:DUF397 domain-containing protein n=1 Tax=Pleurodeles waltl TaxID=8319 RepID=A0AAV7M195_PLEWA|nr:hypothetical protein NDU88_002541 [Pleurodeles waltl]